MENFLQPCKKHKFNFLWLKTFAHSVPRLEAEGSREWEVWWNGCPRYGWGGGGVAAARVEDYKRKCAADKEQHSVVVRQHRRLVASQARKPASKQSKATNGSLALRIV